MLLYFTKICVAAIIILIGQLRLPLYVKNCRHVCARVDQSSLDVYESKKCLFIYFFFEWLAKVKSLVAVACLLPGRAKDLSAPL